MENPAVVVVVAEAHGVVAALSLLAREADGARQGARDDVVDLQSAEDIHARS